MLALIRNPEGIVSELLTVERAAKTRSEHRHGAEVDGCYTAHSWRPPNSRSREDPPWWMIGIAPKGGIPRAPMFQLKESVACIESYRCVSEAFRRNPALDLPHFDILEFFVVFNGLGRWMRINFETGEKAIIFHGRRFHWLAHREGWMPDLTGGVATVFTAAPDRTPELPKVTIGSTVEWKAWL